MVLVLALTGRTDAAPTDALELLELHCVKCHAGSKPKGGLDLATREGLLRGGESGEAISADQPESSLLLQTIRHELDPHMPYKEAKLSDALIAQLVDWVKAGSPYSRTLKVSSGVRSSQGFELTDADRQHWAFQSVRSIDPPVGLQADSRCENPIDQFILARLSAIGLSFAPQASKSTLIRRITLDLIGLPPTPEEVETFLNDQSPCAYERAIDRLLASPHYGERWGRHWLDLARYAETDGFEHDAVRPHSWRYRDYVIQSFNDDKPYDRFVREQLAGDELWPGDPEAVTATGFNLLGPDMVDSSDQIQRRHNTLNDMTDTTALAFLGLTIACARCHDHKFEPLSQRDYYSLQAFFTPARFEREKPIPTPAILATYEAEMREFHQHPTFRELAALETPVRDKLVEKKVAQLSPEAQSAHRTPAEQRTSEQANLVLETADKVKISEKELIAAFSDDEKRDHARLQEQAKKLPRPTPLPKAMALARNDGAVQKTFVLRRGEYSQPGDEVAVGFPEVLRPEKGVPQNTDSVGSAGPEPASPSTRIALANWIASPENPLTSRVMVNRIWQHHFGRGLVQTPSDFGTHGHSPSHPELLHWLAHEFSNRGWSIKQMHKLMLTSATYRQVSAPEKSGENSAGNEMVAWRLAAKSDPDNRLYWRMNRLRLEGEVIRDSLLSVSGELNFAMHGPGVFPPIPKELFAGSTGWSKTEPAAAHSRRSIYIFARRNLRFPFLEVFDAPDSNLSCPIREGSTTAPQALTLLNADEVTAASKATAARVETEAATIDDQIELAFRLSLGRPPRRNELSLGREFVAQSPFSEFCRVLFNLNEFVYVE